MFLLCYLKQYDEDFVLYKINEYKSNENNNFININGKLFKNQYFKYDQCFCQKYKQNIKKIIKYIDREIEFKFKSKKIDKNNILLYKYLKLQIMNINYLISIDRCVIKVLINIINILKENNFYFSFDFILFNVFLFLQVHK